MGRAVRCSEKAPEYQILLASWFWVPQPKMAAKKKRNKTRKIDTMLFVVVLLGFAVLGYIIHDRAVYNDPAAAPPPAEAELTRQLIQAKKQLGALTSARKQTSSVSGMQDLIESQRATTNALDKLENIEKQVLALRHQNDQLKLNNKQLLAKLTDSGKVIANLPVVAAATTDEQVVTASITEAAVPSPPKRDVVTNPTTAADVASATPATPATPADPEPFDPAQRKFLQEGKQVFFM
jgi:hypothetical protein